jgi:hypothetical protein
MQVTYTEGADGNVRADIEIEIEVMVWGMAAMLEGFMVDTAGGAFTEFMEFTHAYLRGEIAAPRPGPPPSVYAPSEVRCPRRPCSLLLSCLSLRGVGGGHASLAQREGCALQ